MDIQFSDRVVQVLKHSQEEAHRLHSTVVRPEHILLGIIKDGAGVAIDTLTRAGVDLAGLKYKLEGYLTRPDQPETDETQIPIVDPGLSNEDSIVIDKAGDRTLKFSKLEARMLHSHLTDSEHILLAMLKDGKGVVSRMLKEYNVSYATFHKQISQSLNGGKMRPTTSDNLHEESPESSASTETAVHKESMQDGPFVPKAEEGTFGKNTEERPMASHMADDSFEEDEAQTTMFSSSNEEETPVLNKFCFDITRAAEEGKLDPVVGREVEVQRLAQILTRRTKNNPAIIGEPGVGKTAIVEGLAQRIASKNVPWLLQEKRILSLDLPALVAGTKFRGQFEERIKAVMKEVTRHPEIILFIDELHTLVGSGASEGSLDAANILKPALSRGEIQCIGATTMEEYRRSIEKDGALERRFQKIILEPTSAEDTLEILKNIRDRYEVHHHVSYTEEALQACISLSELYITERQFPDKAIDVLDEAGARTHLLSAHVPAELSSLEQEIESVKRLKDTAIKEQRFEEAADLRDKQRRLEARHQQLKEAWLAEQNKQHYTIDVDTIAEVVASMSGVPVQKVAASESHKLLNLRSVLEQRIIGQNAAIEKIVRAIQRNRIGLRDQSRPVGTFLFLGPTGVGKTYLAKCIAEEVFSSAENMIRVDMSEYTEKHTVSRLIGAPPGYVGYEQSGQLTEKVRRHPYSVVLFDEIEKAHPEVFNILLQIFDDGHITDSWGRKVNFKNTIIIITSNAGSRQLKDFGTGVGFQTRTAEMQQEAAEGVIRKALDKTFSPEFLNRIDSIVMFRHLSSEDIRKIAINEMCSFLSRIEKLGHRLTIADAVYDFIGEKGYDRNFGARPLRRAIQSYIEDPLCDALLLRQVSEEGPAHIEISMPECEDATQERKPIVNVSSL